MTAIADRYPKTFTGEWHIVRLIDRSFMAPLDRILRNEGIWQLTLASLVLLQTALIVSHEPWLDETQALLIALQTDSLSSLLMQLHYEGHPPLWYFFLRVIAGVTPTVWVLPVANLLLAACVDWAILARAPFSRAEKVSLLLSEFVLIEYLAISRSLTLGVAILLLALALWNKRSVWFCIAALPLCDFFFGVISIILIAFRFDDRKRHSEMLWSPGIGLWLVASACAAWSVIPAADLITEPTKEFAIDSVIFLQQIGTILFPWQMNEHDPMWNGYPPLLIGVFISPFIFAICYLSARSKPIYLICLFGFILLLYLFRVGVYPIYYRHTSLIACLVIAIWWIRGNAGVPMIREMRAWLMSAALCGLASAAVMLFVPFDTSRAAADKIIALGLQDERWFSYPDYRAISISAALERPIINPETRCSFTFVRWNFHSELSHFDEFAAVSYENIAAYGKHYLVTTFPFSKNASHLLKLIGQVPAGYDGQPWYLWEVGPNAPIKRNVMIAPCVPGLRPLSEVFR